MATDEAQDVIDAIRDSATALLGAQLGGTFDVIGHPPGFNYFVQYHQPVYYNPRTQALFDQQCAKSSDGVVRMAGASLSGLFASILGYVVYKTSAADAKQERALSTKVDRKKAVAIAEFEKNFGPITQAQIDAAGCFPPNKTGYIQYIIRTRFGGDVNTIPNVYATFTSAYLVWMNLAAQLTKNAAGAASATARVAAAVANTTKPSDANGGWQVALADWAAGFDGLPSTNAILSSLSDPGRKMTIKLELKSDKTKSTVAMAVAGKSARAVPKASLRIATADGGGAQVKTASDLWDVSDQIDMAIEYTGITLVQANPRQLSVDLSTGWFASDIITEIVQKTGRDVTGLQLSGSRYKVQDLFGAGKSFARVQTFVISNEPTITLTFHHAAQQQIEGKLPKNGKVEVELGDLLSFGTARGDFNVHDIQTVRDTTVVTLGAPAQIGTIPDLERTANIIGGVIDHPPEALRAASMGPSTITVDNIGAFVASFTVEYQQNGARKVQESGVFPVLTTRNLDIPPDATDIKLTIQIATFIKIWTDVHRAHFDWPVSKSFKLSGSTGSPVCEEV